MDCRQDALPGRFRCRDHIGGKRACICGAVNCTRHGRKPAGTSGWAKYVQDHPERAAFYQSGAWKSARERYLAEHPNCEAAGCGQRATIVDHRLSRAEGGAGLDPNNLQSLCAEHHRQKTLAESHRGRKRAAEERRRGRS